MPLMPEATREWNASDYIWRSQDASPLGNCISTVDYFGAIEPTGKAPALAGRAPGPAARRQAQQSLFVLPIPIQYSDTPLPEPEHVRGAAGQGHSVETVQSGLKRLSLAVLCSMSALHTFLMFLPPIPRSC